MVSSRDWLRRACIGHPRVDLQRRSALCHPEVVKEQSPAPFVRAQGRQHAGRRGKKEDFLFLFFPGVSFLAVMLQAFSLHRLWLYCYGPSSLRSSGSFVGWLAMRRMAQAIQRMERETGIESAFVSEDRTTAGQARDERRACVGFTHIISLKWLRIVLP